MKDTLEESASKGNISEKFLDPDDPFRIKGYIIENKQICYNPIFSDQDKLLIAIKLHKLDDVKHFISLIPTLHEMELEYITYKAIIHGFDKANELLIKKYGNS